MVTVRCCSHIFVNLLFLTGSLLSVSCDSKNNVSEYDLDDRVDTQHLTKQHIHKVDENTYYFGFDLRSSPQEDARQYLPFLRYLEKNTGYKFKLKFTTKHQNIIDELGKNHVQFAAIGAESFIRANNLYGVLPLVRGLNHLGMAEYQSVFVVAAKSKIKSLAAIQGKHLAFGARSSTQGHLIPHIVLSKFNLDLKEFASVTYTGSHQSCANAVISGKSDVCAMQDTMAKEMVRKGLLRIIHTSKYYPSSGIAASNKVSVEIVNKVRRALLEFKPQGVDRVGLYHWDKTEMPLGFSKVTRNDYKELEKWSIRLGFVQPVKGKTE